MDTFKFLLISLGLIVFGLGIVGATHNNSLTNLFSLVSGALLTSAGISIIED